MKLTRRQLINLLTELTDKETDDSPIVVQARDVENVKHASKKRDEELLRMMKKRDLELLNMIKDLQSKLKESSSKVRITRRQLRRLIMESVYLPGSSADIYRQTGIDAQRQSSLSTLADTDDEDIRTQSVELFNILRKPDSPAMIDLKINHTVRWKGGGHTFDIPREIYLPILKLYNDPSTGIKDYITGINPFDPSYTEMDIADELGAPWDEFESALEDYIGYVYNYTKSLKQRLNLEYAPGAALGTGSNSDELNRIMRYAFQWLED